MAASFVVTGGAQGIGRALAERLALDGPVGAVDAIPTRSRGPAGTRGCRAWWATPATRRSPGDPHGGRAVLGQDPEARP
jgi:NAD(P)-dependent dehydrogenase (short-subunit alcohol dehydrogenase family)